MEEGTEAMTERTSISGMDKLMAAMGAMVFPAHNSRSQGDVSTLLHDVRHPESTVWRKYGAVRIKKEAMLESSV